MSTEGIAKLKHRVMSAVQKVCTPEEWEDAPIVSEQKECRLNTSSNANKHVAMILDHAQHLAASTAPVETASR